MAINSAWILYEEHYLLILKRKIINDVRKDLKSIYKFSDRLVCTATRNTIVKDKVKFKF